MTVGRVSGNRLHGPGEVLQQSCHTDLDRLFGKSKVGDNDGCCVAGDDCRRLLPWESSTIIYPIVQCGKGKQEWEMTISDGVNTASLHISEAARLSIDNGSHRARRARQDRVACTVHPHGHELVATWYLTLLLSMNCEEMESSRLLKFINSWLRIL